MSSATVYWELEHGKTCVAVLDVTLLRRGASSFAANINT